MMKNPLTPHQTKALADALDAIYDIIYASNTMGPHTLPNGHLYARLMSRVNIDTYTMMIDMLKAQGRITVRNHLLFAVPRPVCNVANSTELPEPQYT
jgi:hypothetical protein